LWNGAEAYLEMWERADGVPVPGCHEPIGPFTTRGRGPMRLGADWRTLLRGVGQPQQRNRAWTWCMRGARNAHKADVAVLSRSGTVELVGSNAHGRRAGGVGVASRKLSARTLRGDMRRLLAAKASRTPHKFVPSAAQAATRGRLTGHILAATGNPATTSALAMLCGLQMQ